MDLAGIGSLLGGIGQIGGAIGGLFGGDDAAEDAMKFQKRQLRYIKALNQNRISWTVEDAKRAGIHPLAALGASSVGGFAQPSFGGASGGGGSSWGDAIADGFKGVADIFDGFDQVNERNYERAQERMREGKAHRMNVRAANQANRELMQRDRQLDLEAQKTAAEIQLLNAQSRSVLMDARSQAIGGAPQLSNVVVDPNAGEQFVTPFGSFEISPTASAQQWEDRYSEPGGWLGALLNGAADLERNVKDWTWTDNPFWKITKVP